jgi:hypothetical protein
LRNNMKKKLALVVLTLTVALRALPATAQTAVYHANLLGISDGRTNIQVEHPANLNRWGQVLGTYGGGLSGGTHAVLWSPNMANDGFSAGTLFPIESSPGMPSGTASTYSSGLNDRGQVTGQAYTPGQGDGGQLQSWMWRPTTLNSSKGVLHGTSGMVVTFPLVQIGGSGTLSEHNQQINNKGAISAYGYSYTPLLGTPTALNGTVVNWTFDPNHGAPPVAINDAGQIAGSSCSGSVWNGPYQHTGAFPPLLDSDILSSPLWIPPTSQECVGSVGGMNARGDLAISAVSSTVNAIHAYLYKKGVATDLSPNVTNGFTGEAFGINNYDQVVGHVDSDTQRATLFQNGQALDLNSLNDSTGFLLREAVAINNAGQILVTAVNGVNNTILLTPNALVTNPVVVTKGPIQISGTTYSQTVTVQNAGTTTITGPISVALDALTAGVVLSNKTGKTVYTGPGSVYADVSSSDLTAGSTTAAFTLVFSNPQLKTITYTARVLGSAAPR